MPACPKWPIDNCNRYPKRIPLVAVDYGVLRAKDDSIRLTFPVANINPACALVAVPCDSHGPEYYATCRLASFLEHSGAHPTPYVCDQESAWVTITRACLEIVKATGEGVGAIPEHSAVRESQPNGSAERSAQQIEDHMRCVKAELDRNIKLKIPSTHTALKCLIKYVANAFCT